MPKWAIPALRMTVDGPHSDPVDGDEAGMGGDEDNVVVAIRSFIDLSEGTAWMGRRCCRRPRIIRKTQTNQFCVGFVPRTSYMSKNHCTLFRHARPRTSPVGRMEWL